MSILQVISHPGWGSFAAEEPAARVPHEPLGRLVLRHLTFGSLAWDGPAAQIAIIRQELVKEEKWVLPQHFKRVFAMYQVLLRMEPRQRLIQRRGRAR